MLDGRAMRTGSATPWYTLLDIIVGPKAIQDFSWPTNVYGADPSLNVNERLNRKVSITGGVGRLEYRSSEGICTVTSSGALRSIAVGTCLVEARWTGSQTQQATSWQTILSIPVGKGTQNFYWPSNPYGSNASLSVDRTLFLRRAIAGGKGTLIFRYGGNSDCSVTSEGVVSSEHIGLCVVETQWTGDDDWNPTPWQEILYITISQGTQSFTWPSEAYGSDPSLAQRRWSRS